MGVMCEQKENKNPGQKLHVIETVRLFAPYAKLPRRIYPPVCAPETLASMQRRPCMRGLKKEALAFRQAQERQVAEARQSAAFFLVSGIDLSAALQTSGEERAAILLRLGRLIERERLKGARRHWSYDLNRHIALKQALERLKRDPNRWKTHRREGPSEGMDTAA